MVLSLALIAAAQAQDTTTGGAVPDLDAENFRPTIDSRAFFRTTDAGLLQDRAPFFGAVLGYAHNPLVYYPWDYDQTGEREVIVGGLTELDLTGGYTIGRFRAGAVVPIYLRGTGDTTSQTGLGDLLLDGKVQALNRDDMPIGLAFSGRLGLPTTTTDLPLGSGGVLGELEADLDKKIGPVLLALDVGHRSRPPVELENLTWGSQLYANLGSAVDVGDHSGLEAELSTAFTYADFGNAAAAPKELLIGGWNGFGELHGLVLHAGAGIGLGTAVSTPGYRLLLSVAYEQKKEPDRDGDGLADSKDTCPDAPEDLDGSKDEDGCPEYTMVTVKVVDHAGKAIPGAAWHYQDRSGKSGDVLQLDNGDFSFTAGAPGFKDGSTRLAIHDQDSAEVSIALDPVLGHLVVDVQDPSGKPIQDATWLLDTQSAAHPAHTPYDLVPGTYAVVAVGTGYRSARQEGVTVSADQSANVVLTLQPAQAVVSATKIEIKDVVHFDTGKATIQSVSFQLLDDVADIIVTHPEIAKIRIEGHTDSVGDAKKNMTLSQARADSVKAYLASKGVDASRLEAVGYGETVPLVPEKTAKDRAKNRRVEFFVAK